MITNHLSQLLEVPGIEAVLLFTYHRKELFKWHKAEFNDHITQEIAETFIQIFGIEEKTALHTREIAVPYEKGIVIARPFTKFFVIVVGKHKLDVPLVRMILDVAMDDVENDRKFQKLIKHAPTEKFGYINEFNLDEKEIAFVERVQSGHGEMSDGSKN